MGSPAIAQSARAGYFAQTRSWVYSAALALPVMVIYELGVRSVDRATGTGVRNGADAILQSFIAMFGVRALVLPVLVTVVLLGLALRDWRRGFGFRRGFALGAVGEAFAYALVFGGVIGRLTALVLPHARLGTGMAGLSLPSQIVLSLGAGFYEEVLFRGIVLGALRNLLGMILARDFLRDAISVVLAAAAFSAYHYLGAEHFALGTFVFRLIAGLALSALLVLRGFGVTVLTHAFYDVLFSLGLAM